MPVLITGALLLDLWENLRKFKKKQQFCSFPQ